MARDGFTLLVRAGAALGSLCLFSSLILAGPPAEDRATAIANTLEGSDGQPRMYVTSPSFNLEGFVGKNVELFGNITMRPDVKWCITVNYLQVMP